MKNKVAVVEHYPVHDSRYLKTRFRWRLIGANGKIVSQSSEGDSFSTLRGSRENFQRNRKLSQVAHEKVL